MNESNKAQVKAGTRYRAVVIGGSAGGVEAISVIIGKLPENFSLPVLTVQHIHMSDDGSLARHIASMTRLSVIEPCDKQPIEAGFLYSAPANYHMLVERSGTVCLSVDARVNWSRPSIDVFFESAARAWGKALIAVILSGANSDGAKGIQAVKKAGGLTIAQDPESARTPVMPQAAIDTGAVDKVLPPNEIGALLVSLGSGRTP